MADHDLPFPIYPDASGFKVLGTSQEAAKRITPKAKRLHGRILEELRRAPRGITADELARRSMNRSFPCPCVTELFRQTKIEPTGERQKREWHGLLSGKSPHIAARLTSGTS